MGFVRSCLTLDASLPPTLAAEYMPRDQSVGGSIDKPLETHRDKGRQATALNWWARPAPSVQQVCMMQKLSLYDACFPPKLTGRCIEWPCTVIDCLVLFLSRNEKIRNTGKPIWSSWIINQAYPAKTWVGPQVREHAAPFEWVQSRRH